MISYPESVIIDNARNYGILKTETYFGFAQPLQKDYPPSRDNATDHMKWILAPVKMDRSLREAPRSPTAHAYPSARGKRHKCIFKIFKKGEEEKSKRRRRRRGGKFKLGKRYMMPVILGLLAAKSVLIPVALKALAFMSAKGLIMGFFSTVMASVLSLKGMFDNQHRHDRKDEKTQVEVIQIPSKHDEHYYTTDDGYPYKRLDILPVQQRIQNYQQLVN